MVAAAVAVVIFCVAAVHAVIILCAAAVVHTVLTYGQCVVIVARGFQIMERTIVHAL